MLPNLTSDFDDPTGVPYFLWDEPMPTSQFRARLTSAFAEEQARLLGKLLREARDTDVWKFVTPATVASRWSELRRHLGRRRSFWEYLLGRWEEDGFIVRK